MVDNFDKCAELLEFDSQLDFYFVQIFQRRKDAGNENMKKNARVIKDYYVCSKEDLFNVKSKIVETCEKYNGRAYLRVNKRNLKRVALLSAKKTMDLILQEDYKAVKNVYNSVCGSHSSAKGNKRWIVDIDTEDMANSSEIRAVIEDLQSKMVKQNYKIIAEMPSKTGFHLITNPFNLNEFNKVFPKIEVQKDSPTNLYIP